MTCGHEQRIDGIAIVPEEEVAGSAYHRSSYGPSSFQLPQHGRRQPAPASGNHHRRRSGVIMTAIALIDVDAIRIDTFATA